MFKQMLGDEEEAPEPPSVYEDDIIEGFYGEISIRRPDLRQAM